MNSSKNIKTDITFYPTKEADEYRKQYCTVASNSDFLGCPYV